MKRLALVLTVAALAAASCTTPGVTPATTTSASTTQAGASAREAFLPYSVVATVGLDSSRYLSGATIETWAQFNSELPCIGVSVSDGTSWLPGTVNCTPEPGYDNNYGYVVRSLPAPLVAEVQKYAAYQSEPGNSLPAGGSQVYEPGFLIRW